MINEPIQFQKYPDDTFIFHISWLTKIRTRLLEFHNTLEKIPELGFSFINLFNLFIVWRRWSICKRRLLNVLNSIQAKFILEIL